MPQLCSIVEVWSFWYGLCIAHVFEWWLTHDSLSERKKEEEDLLPCIQWKVKSEILQIKWISSNDILKNPNPRALRWIHRQNRVHLLKRVKCTQCLDNLNVSLTFLSLLMNSRLFNQFQVLEYRCQYGIKQQLFYYIEP